LGANGSPDENIEYCSKPGGLNNHRYGTPGGQGKRSDIHEALESTTIYTLMDNHPEIYCRYKSGLESIMARKEAQTYAAWRERNELKVYWLWGPTGTGKTYTAFHEHPEIPMD